MAIMLASFFVEPKAEFFLFGLVLYALGSVIQESAFINYYAMLKGVTNESNIGKISGFAWALGYVGGIVLLMVSLIAFVLPDNPVIPTDDSLNIRAIFVF
ncbi:MAG: MFS transporter, partial [bacterium]